MMAKLSKDKDLLSKILKALNAGNYVFTGHASERLQQREVTRSEVKQVLKSGFHEKKKDMYDDMFESWNYSIKGKTIDQRALRVVISFDENEMLVITVIDLGKQEQENGQ